MKKLVILLIASMFLVPAFGCGSQKDDTGEVKVNGAAPDLKGNQGTTNPTGQPAQQTL